MALPKWAREPPGNFEIEVDVDALDQIRADPYADKPDWTLPPSPTRKHGEPNSWPHSPMSEASAKNMTEWHFHQLPLPITPNADSADTPTTANPLVR
ncbi:MAG: hypothetical protein ACJASK_002015 [Ilumatobacter sp.]